ncbi:MULTISPECIES: hypothetical protein [Nostoc]|uniref:Uncharacterized protein n=2 Tax=Nostoc TaxID=1177 RepID=A0ABR8IC72_9NOSO|nr:MULTISPECIES: hypothetical protein [Nostoc]MBD2562764.1 hypothetical protein [Nostoc linckia FACHB-391]MBD2648386.1 hypothetical protein [Nostoc foliaceum FACHB-393]
MTHRTVLVVSEYANLKFLDETFIQKSKIISLLKQYKRALAWLISGLAMAFKFKDSSGTYTVTGVRGVIDQSHIFQAMKTKLRSQVREINTPLH